MAPSASAATCSSRVMYMVAHEDDSLLFQSPDLLHDIQSGACVTTVFTTAGDAGLNQTYWSGREAGAEAGYANMAGVADSWTQSVTDAASHHIATFTLAGAPNVTLLFLRLPDGDGDGSGFAAYGNESLQKLWAGVIDHLHPVDGSAAYTGRDLVDTLASVMTSLSPTVIHVQDYLGTPGDGDHSDHHFTAYFARSAQQQYTSPHTFIGYEDYGTSTQPVDISSTDLTAKDAAFYTYTPYDPLVCQTATTCAGTGYDAWLGRQYEVGSFAGPQPNLAPTANAGPAQTAASGATVRLDGTASSDPNSDFLTYQWTQTAGPAVTLSSATSPTPTFVAPLTSATMTFQLTVNDGQVDSSPSDVQVKVVPPNCAAGQWQAQYYPNTSLTGTPSAVRCEAAIDNDWGSGGPAGVGVGNDNFSIRWTQQTSVPWTGPYTFTATANDGIRVLVDGAAVINQWHDTQTATSYAASRVLAAGSHTVSVEYYENTGDAVAKAGYTSGLPTCPAGQWLAQYYPNTVLTGTAAVRCDAAIDNDWGYGGPTGVGVGNDLFSVRWMQGITVPASGPYKFTATANDGMRVLVDGTPVIDQWHIQAATTYTASKVLAAGSHTITVEYYEDAGLAVAKASFGVDTAPQSALTWSALNASGPTGLALSYSSSPGSAPAGTVCEITMTKGTAIPLATGEVVHSGCAAGATVVRNLQPNTVYTFAVRTRYPNGTVSVPAVRAATTRTVAGYLTDNNHVGHVWHTGMLPASGVGAAGLAVSRTGVVHTLFLRATSTGSSFIYYAWHRPGSRWSTPVALGWAGRPLDRPLFLSLAGSGQLVAGWTTAGTTGEVVAYRIRPPGSARWGSLHRIAANSQLVGLVQDNRGALHLLTSGRYRLTYWTNATGSWTSQTLPRTSSVSWLNGGIAFDPITNRVIVAYSDASPHGSTVIKVGGKPASSRWFSYFYKRATLATPISGSQMSVAAVTSVTADGGRITVGLRRAGATSTAGSYVMSGSAAATVGGLSRIRGTTAVDGDPWTSPHLAGYGGPLVNAVSPTRVIITFTRISPTWRTNAQGVFMVTRLFSTATHRWMFTTPVQRSTSPYDRPVGAARDSAGHLYVAYFRTTCDIARWRL